MNNERTIAVTGANGFIGSHCVIALLQAGFDVVAVVRDPTDPSKTDFLKDEASKIDNAENLSFRKGDLLESGSYETAFEGAWGVLHTAAVEIKTTEDIQSSINGTKNLVESLKKNSNTIKRFVTIANIASIASTRDMETERTFDEDDWNTWSTVENGDPYGYIQRMSDELIFDDKDLQECIPAILSLIPTGVIGPCFTKTHALKHGTFAALCLQGGFAPNLCYCKVDVRDVAKGAVLGFSNKEDTIWGGQRFIINATESQSMLELSDIVKKVYPEAKGLAESSIIKAYFWLGFRLPTFLRKFICYQGYMDHMFVRWQVDNTKSKTVLGMEYRSIEETCKDCVESIVKFIAEEGLDFGFDG